MCWPRWPGAGQFDLTMTWSQLRNPKVAAEREYPSRLMSILDYDLAKARCSERAMRVSIVLASGKHRRPAEIFGGIERVRITYMLVIVCRREAISIVSINGNGSLLHSELLSSIAAAAAAAAFCNYARRCSLSAGVCVSLVPALHTV